MLVAALTRGATLAVRIAFPALIAAATTTLAAGMISRALPQMETLSWMAALVWLVVLSSIAVGMASLGTALPYELERIWELMATR
jgi:flagellar biosynthesis protein FliR